MTNVPPPSSSGLSTDDLRKVVVGWSKALQSCADLAVQSAHDDFIAGNIGLSAYNDALQADLAITQTCIDMVNRVDATLATATAASLSPITAATARLTEATATANRIMDGVAVVADVVAAAAAVAAVVAAPSPTTIGAAAGAIGGIVGDVVKTVQQK
jgi:hypothetical protein